MALIDLASYKFDLAEAIISVPTIVAAIDPKFEDFDPAIPDSILNKNIFVYDYVPDIQTVTETYLLIEAAILRPHRSNDFFNDVQTSIRILCHQSRMQMKGYSGTRLDYIAYELTKLLDGDLKYGMGGGLRLQSNVPGMLNETYKFRLLTFENLDVKESKYYVKDYGQT
jgi:hypothetical protein